MRCESGPRHIPPSASLRPSEIEDRLAGTCDLLDIVHTPMRDSVAKLQSTERGWLLYLDTGSSPEDLCWAMTDVLRLLAFGPDSAQFAVPQQRMYVVR